MDPEQNQSNPTYPTQPSQVRQPVGQPQQKKNKNALAALFLVIAIILIAGSVFLYLGKKKESENTASPTPESFDSLVYEETPEPMETETPAPANKSQISITILNGTGTAKDASFVKDILVDLGYKEDKIEVGNASPQNYTSTDVSFNSDVSKTIQDEITTALKKEYQTVKTQNSASQTIDVKIITGLKTGQTPKPSTTATPASTAKPSSTPTSTPTSTP